MLIRSLILSILLAPLAGFAQDNQTTNIEITTLRGQMKYSESEFQVAPGAKVRITLKNEDDMHHNLVICKPGENKEQEVAKKAWDLGGDGFAKQWIPEHPDLLFASPMADPQKSVVLEFTAPKEEGIYPYVCTLPGHSIVMRGQMIVGGGPMEKNGLSELTYVLYQGSWQSLPDFDTLEPKATDHVNGGLITIDIPREVDNNFGIVFKAKLEAPADGKYSFDLSSDDGTRLLIDGKKVIEHDGIHAMSNKKGSIKLTKGLHDLEVQYFEGAGEEGIALSWSGPGFNNVALSDQEVKKKKNDSGPSGIPLSPSDTEAIVYRNFIEGAGSRAIGVGYPGGVNLAYDADQMRVALVWQGAFIDAARHWNGRGQGFQPPLGYNVYPCVEGSPFARLSSPNDPWPNNARKPSTQQPDNGFVFKGYRLDGSGRNPEFRFLFGSMAVTDLPIPTGNVKDNTAGIQRTITVHAKDKATDIYFRAASGSKIEKLTDSRFRIDDQIFMTIVSDTPPLVRQLSGKQELIVPLTFKDNKASVQQTYSWN